MKTIMEQGAHLFLLTLLAFASPVWAEEHTWDAAVAPGGNTPATAYNWFEKSNWTDKESEVPNVYGTTMVVGKANPAPRFFNLGEGVKSSYFNAINSTAQANGGNHFLGDVTLSGGSAYGNAKPVFGLSSGDLIYGTVSVTGDASMSMGYVSGAFAGQFKPKAKWGLVGTLAVRCDLFADSAVADRTSPFNQDYYDITQGEFHLYGAKGAIEQESNWAISDGSAYLQYAGDGASTVVPGMTVTSTDAGVTIPSGTFVRYVFADTGWIALSQPISGSGLKKLHFAAITPSITVHYRHNTAGQNGVITARKYREEDGCRLILDQYRHTKGTYTTIGLSATDFANYIPADIAIAKNSIYDGDTDPTHRMDLRNCRIVFPESYTTPQYPYFSVGTGYEARMTAEDGVEAVLSTVKDILGTVDKCGPGALKINMATASTSGKLKVSSGVLELTKDTSLGANQLYLAELEIAAGATFRIPADGVRVGRLVTAEGAIVEGPGVLILASAQDSISGIKLTGGASVSYGSESELIGGKSPWFDLDATVFGTSKMTTLVENGTNFVTRWYDAHGNGQYAARRNTAAVGSASFPDGSGYCWIRENAYNGMPYVDMGPYYCSQKDVDARLYGPDRSLRLYTSGGSGYKQGGGTTIGEALPSLTAAFFVVGSEYEGGSLLGAAGANFDSYGIIHGVRGGSIWCHQNANYDNNQLRSRFTDANLASGSAIFRVNGTSCQPATTGYSKGFDVITVKAPTSGSGVFKGGCLGYFGQETCTAKAYEQSCGGLLYGEVLLLTNSVTTAQINEIEAFLRYKWRGEWSDGFPNVDMNKLDLGDGSSISTVAVRTKEIAGSGTVNAMLNLTGDAVVAVRELANGTLADAVKVHGRATMPAYVTIRIDSNGVGLVPGTYTVFEADELYCPTFAWTVSGPSNRSYELQREGDRVLLKIAKKGLAIVVR